MRIEKKRLNFDTHRAIGLWFWPLLLAIALSAASLNLRSELFVPLVNLFSSLTPTPFETVRTQASSSQTLDYGKMQSIAESTADAMGIKAPLSALGHRASRHFYYASYRHRDNETPDFGTTRLFFDDRTGKLIFTQFPGSGSAGELFLQLQYPLHSGRIAGLPGRILISITGCIVALLSITGLLIWYRKLHTKNRADISIS